MPRGMTINEKGELVPKQQHNGGGGGGGNPIDGVLVEVMGLKVQAIHLIALAAAFYLWDVEGVVIVAILLVVHANGVFDAIMSSSQKTRGEWNSGRKKRSVNNLETMRQDERQEQQAQQLRNTAMAAVAAGALYQTQRRRKRF